MREKSFLRLSKTNALCNLCHWDLHNNAMYVVQIFLHHPAASVIDVVSGLPLMTSYENLLGFCIVYGIFAGGIPGNGPMVYAESFQDELASSMGLASIGRALAALSLGPLASKCI